MKNKVTFLNTCTCLKTAYVVFMLLVFLLSAGRAYAQYPSTGTKSRLGWQTTGDGLIWRGVAADTVNKPNNRNYPYFQLDTTSGILRRYIATRGRWQVIAGGPQGLQMPFDSITFNPTTVDPDTAELKYNADLETFVFGADGTIIEIGQKTAWYVKNQTGSTITKGTVVRASGALGSSGRILVSPMIIDGTVPARFLLGVAASNIPNGADGYVIHFGKLRKFNTSAWSDGAVLYAGAGGTLTATEPSPPNLRLPIAFVVHSHATNGILAVRIQTGNELHELHDVDTTGIQNNGLLVWNSSAQKWQSSTPDGDKSATNEIQTLSFSSPNLSISSGNSVSLSSLISGAISGTTNTLAMFTGANTIGNSSITESSGEIIIGGTGSLRFPNGTTAQRPAHAAGKARWNTTTGFADISDGTNWRRLTMQTDAAFSDTWVPVSNSSGVLSGSSNLIFNSSGLSVVATNNFGGVGFSSPRSSALSITSGTEAGFIALVSGGSQDWSGGVSAGDFVYRVKAGAKHIFSYNGTTGHRFNQSEVMLVNNGNYLFNTNDFTAFNVRTTLNSLEGLTVNTYTTLHGNGVTANGLSARLRATWNGVDALIGVSSANGIYFSDATSTDAIIRGTGASAIRLGVGTGNSQLRISTNGIGVLTNPVSGFSGVFGGTGGIIVPSGTTAQRPTATAGALRYNSTLGAPEWSNGTTWFSVPTTDNNGIYTGDGSLQPNIITNSWFNSAAGTGWYWYNQNDWQGVGHFSTLDPIGYTFDAALESTVRRTSGSTETGAFRASSGYYGTGRDASRAIQHDLIVSKGGSPVKRVIALMSNQFDNGQRNSGLIAHIDSASNTTSAQMRISVDDINPLTNGKKIYVAGLARNFPTNLGTDFIIMPNGSTPNYLVQSLTRSGGGWTNYDWIRIADMSDQSTTISLYNGSYALPNAAPTTSTDAKSAIEWQGNGTAASPVFVATGTTRKYITTSTTYTSSEVSRQRELVIWANLATGSTAQLAITVPDPASTFENNLITIYAEDASAIYSIEVIAAGLGNSFYFPTTAGSAPTAQALLGITDATSPWFNPGSLVTLRCLNRNGTWYWVPTITAKN